MTSDIFADIATKLIVDVESSEEDVPNLPPRFKKYVREKLKVCSLTIIGFAKVVHKHQMCSKEQFFELIKAALIWGCELANTDARMNSKHKRAIKKNVDMIRKYDFDCIDFRLYWTKQEKTLLEIQKQLATEIAASTLVVQELERAPKGTKRKRS
ncbi:hypothetical protein BC832DRAFT_559804 [Gaertneriomyces semiglobifer]|nr:hypothetical protein BC832DRAFT_559804 [Gaertneriomyces semiglobifer]